MKKKKSQSREVRQNIDKVLHGVIYAGNELKSLLRKARDKFEEADEETKKKVVMGVAGAVAALTAIIGIKKITKKTRKKD